MQTLGPDTVIKDPTYGISQLSAICGATPSGGAQSGAGEALVNTPNGEILVENIVDWASAKDAAQAITNDINDLGQNGCSYSGSGSTEQYSTDITGSPPQGCGQYLSTQSSVNSFTYNGNRVEAQCRTFTIEIDYLTSVPEPDSLSSANGYLNNALGRLMSTVR